MSRLFKYFEGYRAKIVFGSLFKLFEACLELTLPVIMATLINNAFGVQTKIGGYVIPLTTTQCIVLLSVFIIAGFGFAVCAQYFAAVGSMGFGGKLRSALFKHIFSLSNREIEALGTESYVNRLTNDVNQIQLAVAMFVRLIFRAPVLCVGALIMAFLIDTKIAIIFAVSIPIVSLVLFLIMKRTIPMHKKVQSDLDRIGVVTRENLTGARVIRAFSGQDKEIDRGIAATENYYQSSVKVNKLSAAMNPLTALIMNLSIAVIVIAGAHRVAGGHITPAEISAFVTYILWLLLALTIIANISVLITRALASADRVSEILQLNSSVADEGLIRETPQTEDTLKFENVFFRYNDTEYILKDISFAMQKGETIGIIGGTGSGKSTLAALIARFYDAERGAITLNGEDIKSYPLDVLRHKVAVVMQNSTLFKGSLRENIALGDENPNDNHIIDCLKAAAAWEFVKKLKDGLDTAVLAGGRNFSGGQLQRLTIARALYRRAEILILDDSSSALDFATDARLRKNLAKIAKHTNVIVISQRVGTVRQSDKIIVLDKGRIAGIGAHKELLETSPIYREICLTQFKEDELNG
ncbi:MAG: ABC transporter ATP-binding protein [Clostridia bacterium]